MKEILILLSLTFAHYGVRGETSCQAASSFDDWFTQKTLRIDYMHVGNSASDQYALEAVKREPYWGGSKRWLVDETNAGKNLFKVYDASTHTLLYSRGYCTLFDEWQNTAEASRTTRSFPESVVMPFPKKNVQVEFLRLNDKGKFEIKFSYVVRVDDIFINDELNKYPADSILISGKPENKVDVVILPEGYTEKEMSKFKEDCRALVRGFFKYAPYSDNKSKFNFRSVLAPSKESGTDNPEMKVFKNTLLNTGFYTDSIERYLMTPDMSAVRNVAANVPYDQIIILVNTGKYGGGALFNFYSLVVNSDKESGEILVHEFGHSFGGLADEYDDGSTTYNSLYPLNLEPWEPNITTLVHFETKWKDMLPRSTPIPTPLSKNLPIGVYEGAGYVSKGIYRPMQDCMMRTFDRQIFCPVCKRTIQKMIDKHCDK